MTFTEFTRGASAVFKFATAMLGFIYIFVTAKENLFEDPIYTILVILFYYIIFTEHARRSND